MIRGRATKEATERFASARSKIDYNELGNSGLIVSACGFGGYRIDVGVKEHRDAFRHALLQGINLVDTSANYGDGASEELIGEVVTDLIDEGELERESLVVVSKVGYLQGQNYELSQARKAKAIPFPELVEYDEGLEHCIHPEFIEDQLKRSLARLDLETIDIYLLHNPEYFLSVARSEEQTVEEARQEYYRRIEAAFRYLEKAVAKGHIQFYGISSNTLPAAADEYEFTSLEKIWQIAESITKDHHFRVIQFPMNLYESGATLVDNQTEKKSVVGFASDRKLGTLVNRPLNAIFNNQLFRLTELKGASEVTKEQVEASIDTLVDLCKNMGGHIKQSDLAMEVLPHLLDMLKVGNLLKQHALSLPGLDHWLTLLHQQMLPGLRQGLNIFSQYQQAIEGDEPLLEPFIVGLNRSLDDITSYYQSEAAKRVVDIKATLSNLEVFPNKTQPLSQLAIHALRATEGVSSVLVGMRHRIYVDDVVAELNQPVVRQMNKEIWQQLAARLAER